MPWAIRRLPGGPDPYSLGPVILQFDAEGWCYTENPNVVTQAQRFPEAFLVEDMAASAAQSPPPAEDLDEMTMVELRRIARDLDIDGVSGMNKAELLDAIRAAQET